MNLQFMWPSRGKCVPCRAFRLHIHAWCLSGWAVQTSGCWVVDLDSLLQVAVCMFWDLRGVTKWFVGSWMKCLRDHFRNIQTHENFIPIKNSFSVSLFNTLTFCLFTYNFYFRRIFFFFKFCCLLPIPYFFLTNRHCYRYFGQGA